MNQLGQLHRPFIFIINYLQDVSYIEEVAAADSAEVLYNLNGFINQIISAEDDIATYSAEIVSSLRQQPFVESFSPYQHSFNTVRRNILAGNGPLTSSTCRTPVETNLTLKDIYLHSKAIYKLWIKDRFTVFSPEIFVRIHQGRISSYPMKGTIDASISSVVRLLMNDPKETVEHATIADLIRNDLSMVANRVSASRYWYMDRLQTNRGVISQASSEIQSILPENYQERLGDIIFRLLPAGSITGAPRRKTMQITQKAETYDRGFYTGVIGYSDGIDLDSVVMIRLIEQEGEKMHFKSGGEITRQSDVESEHNGMKQKVYVPIY